MKIAQIVCRFKPYKGGISNMAYDQALGLAKLGHDVTVFTPLYNDKDNYDGEGFEVVRLKSWIKFGNAAFLPQLFWRLKGFDIIHLHYPFFGGAKVVWLLKLLSGRKMKFVITYHHDVVGKGIFKWLFRFNTKFIMPRIIRSADKVIVTSLDYAQNSNIKELLKDNQKKFSAIPPSVDLARFFPQAKDSELLKKYNLTADDKILLFVGGLDQAHYFKGIEFLIKSLPKVSVARLKLIIVGDGDLRAGYEKQAQELGLGNKIIFAGKVSDEDLPKYYNLADAVILPSIDKSEAFGIVLIEAMACSKPVIASNLAGVRSVFSDGQEGFVIEVGNESDLVEKVNKLLSDDNLRNQLGQAARAKAVDLYSIDVLIKKIEEVYLTILK